jgi:hypothetical protein
VVAVDEQRAWLLELAQETMVLPMMEKETMTLVFDEGDVQRRTLAGEVLTLSDDDDQSLGKVTAPLTFLML